MSKYKVKFWCDSGANAFSCNTETVDLVDDWNYTEDEAKEIFESEEKQEEILDEWLVNYLDCGIRCLEDIVREEK